MTKNAFEELNASQEASGKSKFSTKERSGRFFETTRSIHNCCQSLNFSRTVKEMSSTKMETHFDFLNLLKKNGFVVNGLTEICSTVDQALLCHEKILNS